MARSIELDGELSTDPDETFDQARRRIVDCDNGENLCEMVGYMGCVGDRTIMVETHEARCTLFYDYAGKLIRASVSGRIIWQREAA